MNVKPGINMGAVGLLVALAIALLLWLIAVEVALSIYGWWFA